MNYLITGAGRGIGRGLTRSLLSQGHRVYLVDSDTSELQNTLSLAPKWVQASGPVPYPYTTADQNKSSFQGKTVDLSDRAAIKTMVAEASDFFDGKLDVLVNNAFPTPHTWAEDKAMDDDGDGDDSIMAQWDMKIAVGLTAPFLLTRLCVPLFLAAKPPGSSSSGDSSKEVAQRGPGCVINISSSRWKQAEDNHEGYSAAKAGLQGLTTSMAVSLGHKYGIRINSISPGWIDVEEQNREADEQGKQWGSGLTEEDHKWHPAGRVGRVEDIVRAVVFLAESGFVTGEDVQVDGGVGRKMVYPE